MASNPCWRRMFAAWGASPWSSRIRFTLLGLCSAARHRPWPPHTGAPAGNPPARATDTRFAGALPRLNRNPIEQVYRGHGPSLNHQCVLRLTVVVVKAVTRQQQPLLTLRAAFDGGHEVDLACRFDCLAQPQRADLAIHCYRQVGAKAAAIRQPVADARPSALEIFYHFTDRGAGRLDRGTAAGQLAQHRRDVYLSHASVPLLPDGFHNRRRVHG